jgi:hypothetical protein
MSWGTKRRRGAQAMRGAIDESVADLAKLTRSARATVTKHRVAQPPPRDPPPATPEQRAARARRRRAQIRMTAIVLALGLFGEWLRRQMRSSFPEEG